MLWVETLETRELPAVSLSPQGLLFVQPDPGREVHTVSVDRVGDMIQTVVDGDTQLFPSLQVQRLLIRAVDNERLVAQNNTNVDSTLIGSNRSDTLFGGLGRNLILPGGGNDVVYALLGINTIAALGGGSDRIFTNNPAQVSADRQDLVVRFFATGRTPGSPFIGVQANVLYITPSNNGSSVRIDPLQGNRVRVVADLGDGLGQRQLDFSGVQAISYFGGTGADRYVNNTHLVEAAYGSAGNDVLISGTGLFSLLKGSGGDDVLVGRAVVTDLSGNLGSDVLVRLGSGSPRDVFRVDGQDFVSGGNAGVRITP